MMMNSTSAVYGCPPGQQHHNPQTTLDYDTKLFYPAEQQHPAYGYATDPAEPQTGHLPPHQIINESNGLSYTNLDASGAGQSAGGHHYRQSGPYTSSCGHFYQSFDYDSLSGNHPPETSTSYHQPPGYHHHPAAYHHHHQTMSRTSRTNGIVYPPSGGNGYLGYESGHHVQQECHQMNGGVVAPYQRPAHQQPPIPTYKWMQVKRSLPKPGEYISHMTFERSGGKKYDSPEIVDIEMSSIMFWYCFSQVYKLNVCNFLSGLSSFF